MTWQAISSRPYVAAQTDAAAALEADLRLSHSSASLDMMSATAGAFSSFPASSSAAVFSPSSSSSSPDAFSFAAKFLSDPAAALATLDELAWGRLLEPCGAHTLSGPHKSW